MPSVDSKVSGESRCSVGRRLLLNPPTVNTRSCFVLPSEDRLSFRSLGDGRREWYEACDCNRNAYTQTHPLIRHLVIEPTFGKLTDNLIFVGHDGVEGPNCKWAFRYDPRNVGYSSGPLLPDPPDWR